MPDHCCHAERREVVIEPQEGTSGLGVKFLVEQWVGSSLEIPGDKQWVSKVDWEPGG